MVRTPLLASVFGMVFASDISAGTITFDDAEILDFDDETFTELGFTFGNSIAYYEGTQLYLHDDNGLLTSIFTRDDGRLFSVRAGEVSGYSRLYKGVSGPNPDGSGELDYSNGGNPMHLELEEDIYYQLEGYRNGSLVSSLTSLIPTGLFPSFQQTKWGGSFADIDTFVISLLLPPGITSYAGDLYNWPWDGNGSQYIASLPFGPGEYLCEEWCAGLQFDSLRVSTVPLPATLPLLGAGFVAMGLIGLRRRKRS